MSPPSLLLGTTILAVGLGEELVGGPGLRSGGGGVIPEGARGIPPPAPADSADSDAAAAPADGDAAVSVLVADLRGGGIIPAGATEIPLESSRIS